MSNWPKSPDSIAFDLTFTGRITVEARADDYMAYFDGDKARWESGSTVGGAIGKLVISHGQPLSPGRVNVEAVKLHKGVLAHLPGIGWVEVAQAVSKYHRGLEHVRVTTTDGIIATLPSDSSVMVAEDSL